MGWDDIGKDVDKGHLSASQISMFQRCPLQYKYRYIDGMKRPPDSGLVVGIAVHKGIEHNYHFKYKKGKAANKNEVMDAYSNQFDESHKDAEFYEDAGKAKDRGYGFTEKHFDKIAPTVMPTKPPEQGFEVSIIGVKRKLIGYVDAFGDVTGGLDEKKIEENPETIKNVIIDNKTTKRSFTKWESEISVQLTSYAYAWYRNRKKGEQLGGVSLDVLASLPSGKIKTARALTPRSLDQLKRFERTVQTIEKTIDSGLFYPTDNAQACSWCGFNSICHDAAVKRKHESKLM